MKYYIVTSNRGSKQFKVFSSKQKAVYFFKRETINNCCDKCYLKLSSDINHKLRSECKCYYDIKITRVDEKVIKEGKF